MSHHTINPDRSRTPLAARPAAVRALGVTLVLVLGALGVLGAWLWSNHHRSPTQTASAAPSQTPTPFPLTLPPVLSTVYARNTTDTHPSSAPDGSTAVSATYLKGGSAAVLVMVSRPSDDAVTFLQAAGFGQVTADPHDGACGISSTDRSTGCAVIRNHTAILTVGILAQRAGELLALDRDFAQQIAG